MNTLKLLARSRKFWIAVFGVVQTLVFHYFTDFPTEVWASIDALVVVLIGSIAAEDVADKQAAPLHRAIDADEATFSE